MRRAQHHPIEEGKLAGRGQQRVGARALPRHHDLGRAQAQIERVEQREVREQILAARWRAIPSNSRSAWSRQACWPVKTGEPDQVLRGECVRVGRGVVGGGARPHHQALGVVGGEEIAAVVGIGVVAIEAYPARRARARDRHARRLPR